MKNERKLAAIGKLLEELGECVAACSRTVIQGLDGVDPDDGTPNLIAVSEEIADVRGLSQLVIDELNLDHSAIAERGERKRKMKLAWLEMLDG